MIQKNVEKGHMGTLGRLSRRAVSFGLAVAMSLSFMPATSWAASPITPPTQITEATKSDFPKIEFQTNFVRTEYGSLTGLMEVAIRVGPSAKDGDGTPIPVDFQSVAATLQFNTDLYTPISWQWAYNEDGTAPGTDLKLSAKDYYDVQLPAMKDDTLPGTGAIAQCGIVADSDGMTTNVASGDQALLFFKAEAYGTAITIAEMTTLAVIRFYVNPVLMDHISIERDKKSFSPEWGYNYNVVFDGNNADYITTRDKLDNAIGHADHLDSTTGTTTLLTDALSLPTDFVSVGFAADSDMAESDSPADMSLHYSAGNNEFYFVPGYDAGNASSQETVEVEVGTGSGKTKISLDAPVTGGSRVLALKSGAPVNSTAADDYSYLSNLIPAENITFPVVSQMSFADHGDGRENMATILFYDWDDTLIGVLVVPRNDDARAIVNAYVRNNMIHPDLRFDEEDRDGSTDPELITSLARVNTYRGKYPATGPMPDGATDATVDTNGKNYPLTNKLDYSFLTRPMELTASGTTATGELTSTWTQAVTGTEEGEETFWDYEYPYIHGWVLVPDENLTDIVYTHPENIWTTIGVGELLTYNGATNGGYLSMNGAPAELTAIGQEFEFANFNFFENKQDKNTVYAVKAVYEPGESLLIDGYPYRMISEPYYNKLNAGAASAGGAYSADVVFERASTEVEGEVRGVARMREPYVRQDTTNDLRWEEIEELGISHNLTNATSYEAYSDKGKTTYTKVDVSNVEEVGFSLTLSARQNKVDYFLIEGYGYNFVAGGARSDGDGERRGTIAVADNYNYFVDGDSDLSDEWYDAPYESREGSRGFVLTGTLNQIMEKVTQCYNRTLERSSLYAFISTVTLADINLRMNADGKVLDSFDEVEEMIDILLSVVDDAKTNHYGVTGYWNSDPAHDCAEVSWHQLQLFVLDYATKGSAATLRDPNTADVEIIKWCHLHEECVAKTSGKPRNWKELIETAKLSDAADKIALLTITEMESIAHLRADRNGTPFNTVADFAAAVIAAVQAGHSSWDAVQDYIIRGRADVAYAQANYWWYDGSTSVRLNSLTNLIDTTQDVFNDVTLPDGTTGRRYAKLNQLNEAFDANGGLDGDEAAASWITATENLVKTDSAEKFDTFDDFKTAFIGALTALGTEATWYQMQYYILHGTDPASDPNAETEYASYYWHNGGRRVTDVSSLMSAAQKATQGDTVSWDAFTYTDLYTYPGLKFSKDFKGTQYSDTEFDDFKTAILTLVAQGANRTWNQVQYYLIHGDLGNVAVVNNEAQYYWWANGGEGDAFDFTTVSDYASGLTAFIEAAFRYEINGNTHAWDNLTTDIIKTGRLITSDNGATLFDSLGHFSSATAFVMDIEGFASVAGAVMPSPGQNLVKPDEEITWQQMQYYLLNGKSFVDADTAGAENYWWRNQDDFGNVKGPDEYFADLLVALQDVFDNGDEGVTAIQTWFQNLEQLNAVFTNWGVPFTQDDADMYAALGYSDFWTEIVDSGDYSAASEVSWYQIQYLLLNWGYSYMPDSDVKDELEGSGISIPDWVPNPVSLFMMMRAMTADSTSAQIMALTERVNSLVSQIRANPTKADEYEEELAELMTAMEELKALLEGSGIPVLPEEAVCTCGTETEEHEEDCPLYVATEEPVCACGSEDGVHAEDCPLYMAPEEPICTCGSEDGVHMEDCPLYVAPEVPAESPEVTEIPEPSESEAPAESLQPEETEPPEEKLPQTSAPGNEEPEVTATPEPVESMEPSAPIDPPETEEPETTPSPTGSPEAEYTIETMPEVVNPVPEEIEEDGPAEEADAETVTISDFPETEVAVVETLPPLGIPKMIQSRSDAMDYKKLTTKIAQIKLRTRAGGMRMKQLKINRIISPPGQLSAPLLLRTETIERRRAL